MRRLSLVVVLSAALAAAHGIDAEATGGAGSVTASGPSLAAATVGVEACFFCAGRFGLFSEYAYWSTSGTKQSNPSDLIHRTNLAGGGLRIQELGRIRAFFDIGAVAGFDEHWDSSRTRALGGVVVGAGVRLPLNRKWYIRPQVRTYGLSPHTLEGVDAHWAVTGIVGIGYSWK